MPMQDPALHRPLLCSRRVATRFMNPLQTVALQQMEWNVRHALDGDTSAISALRVLHLYLERLGSRHLPSAALQVGTECVRHRVAGRVQRSLVGELDK